MTAYQKYVTRVGSSAAGVKSSGDYGATRGQWLNKTATWINRKLPNSLSYFDCVIDGQPRKCGIVTQNNTDQKRIMSMPGQRLYGGSYVEWMDQIWIIFQVQAPYELYQAALMRQCNYLMKWVNDRGEIVQRWVYAEDGTKYQMKVIVRKYSNVLEKYSIELLETPKSHAHHNVTMKYR